MNDLRVPVQTDIAHHFVSSDCVFRPLRCQPCFLRGCNSSNRLVSWGLKSITITCINSSFRYSHCGIIFWTMDQLTAEPIPNLICRMNHCMAFFAAIRQSIAFFIFRVWGTLAASIAYSWYTIHTPHNQNSCILVIILNEIFVSNSSPSDGSVTMDRGLTARVSSLVCLNWTESVQTRESNPVPQFWSARESTFSSRITKCGTP